MLGNIVVAFRTFLEGVARARLGKSATDCLESIRRLAARSPQNFRAQLHILEAEIALTEGRFSDARSYFLDAIDEAEASGILHLGGWAHDRLSEVLLERGLLPSSRFHAECARQAYVAWGATRLVERLDARLAKIPSAAPSEVPKSPSGRVPAAGSLVPAGALGGFRLDVGTIVKAAQSIASEIALDRLLERMIFVSMENAGADHGALLLETEAGLSVVAEGTPDGVTVYPEGKIPLRLWDGGAHSLVHVASRTQRAIVVSNAAVNPEYRSDMHVSRHQVASILALPIRRQGRLSAVLYLENRQVSDVFSKQRIELLELLAGHVSVALHNARLIDELQRAAETARESERLKARFLANMSHELRTPLNAIINIPEGLLAGFSEHEVLVCPHCNETFALEDGDRIDVSTPCPACRAIGLSMRREWSARTTPTELVPLLRTIERSGRYLLEIVNSILEYSRLEAGRATLHPVDIDLGEFFDDIRDALIALASSKSVGLHFHVDRSAPPLRADRLKLIQILNNLIGNAIKFSPKGTRVDVEAKLIENGPWEISVRDEGVGIAEHLHEAIFESFRQGESESTRSHGGTGLGLAITRKFVELHGGVVVVESQLGRGSTFRVRLPRERANARGGAIT
jgi:signal transduction histidine kinase